MRCLFLCIYFVSFALYGTANDCQILSVDDVVLCVVAKHPELVNIEGEIGVLESRLNQASQPINPKLESEILFNGKGDFRLGTSYLHTFERGGKRQSRHELFKAEVDSTRSVLRAEKEKMALETLSHLYGIHQNNEVLHLIEEILSIYASGISKYTQQNALPPELEVARDILSVAHEEMLSRQILVKSNKQQHKAWLQRVLGKELPADENIWLSKIDRWLPMPESSTLESASHEMNRRRVQKAEARLGLEKSSAFSDLSLGPVVELEKSGDKWFTGVGVGFSIDLPVYHKNEAAIASASKEIAWAQDYQERQIQYEKSQLDALMEQYHSSIKRLNALNSSKRTSKLHLTIDKKGLSGLFSPQTIIEAHRQLIESIERKHELENMALNAKWMITMINGNLIPNKDVK